MTRFDRIYADSIARIMRLGADCFNERTGLHTKAIPGFTYELYPSDGFPLLTLRKIPVRLFVAEVIWMLTGEKDMSFFQKFSHAWDDFAEDDNTMETAYGYRWRHHFGRDQLLELVEHLKHEPSSRQGVVMMWDPSSDGLLGMKKKNVPCPFVWITNIIHRKLNLHLVIRSNDMMLGNPHDIAGFALLQSMLAQELKVKSGKLTISISHAHIYENHYEQAWEIVERARTHTHKEIRLNLPENSFQRGLTKDESLVKEITKSLKEYYQPLPPVKRMKVAI